MSTTSLGPKPNIILFDQQPSYMQQIPSQTELTKNPDVLSLLADLNKRILKIQIYEQVLRDKTHSLQNKTNPLSTTNLNITNNTTHQQIINVLQRKLHMLIIQSNKALEDLKDQVERILTREIMDKKVNDYQTKAQNDRLEKMYLQKIKEMQSAHSAEILKLERKNQAIQKAFQQRMDRIQSKLLNKIKQFQRRQQGYRNQVQRLKVQALDNKKFQKLELELQQTKIALKNLPEKQFKETTGTLMGGTVTGFTSRFDPADKDTTYSRMRRNKIFQKKQEEAPSIVTPVQTYQNQYTEVASMNLLSKQLEDLTSELHIHFNPNFSGSDEDVFFYPETSKARMVAELESSTKIASPFDLNNRF